MSPAVLERRGSTPNLAGLWRTHSCVPGRTLLSGLVNKRLENPAQ
jgi:hypothetical protein